MTLTVSKAILCEVGRIAVAQSHIEGQMALFIRELLYLDDQRGYIVTMNLSFRLLIETLESLLREELGDDHPHFKTFETLRDEMRRREQERNQIIHSMWSVGSTFGSDTATRVKVVRKKSDIAKRAVYPVTIDELKEMAQAMENLDLSLGNLRARVCHYEASVRKPREPRA
jgi:hypothetical protein